MTWWTWTLLGLAAITLIVTVVALGNRRSRTALIELVKLVPACVALIRDILRDPTISRWHKIAPAIAIAYLASPIDLVPDFIPGMGQLDDALVIAWTLRHLVRVAGRERVEQHWTGDPNSLQRILRLAGLHDTTGQNANNEPGSNDSSYEDRQNECAGGRCPDQAIADGDR